VLQRNVPRQVLGWRLFGKSYRFDYTRIGVDIQLGKVQKPITGGPQASDDRAEFVALWRK
jgi:hypothetical protein